MFSEHMKPLLAQFCFAYSVHDDTSPPASAPSLDIRDVSFFRPIALSPFSDTDDLYYHYLDIPIDQSQIWFIRMANSVSLPLPQVDR